MDELSARILTDHHMAGEDCHDGATPPGEGAAILMLETAAHARARGARPLAELCGLSCSTEPGKADGADDGTEALEAVIREALQEAGIVPEQVIAVCADAPRARMDAIAARLCPAWPDRRVSVARLTGHMEGAQILADLEAAWRIPVVQRQSGYVLGLVSSAHGLNCAALFKKD